VLFFGKGKNYEKRKDWCSPFESEKQVIENLLNNCDGKYAIEIGSFYGNTTARLATICEKKNIILFVIDPWIYANSYYIYKQNIKSFNCINTIKKTSKKALKEIKPIVNQKCGFIFIDGDHSYQTVKFDLENYFPLLLKNGVIISHDIYFSTDVKKAFDEFSKDKNYKTFKYEPTKDESLRHHPPEWSHANLMGLGWIFKD